MTTPAMLPVWVGQPVCSQSGRPIGTIVEIEGPLIRIHGPWKDLVVDFHEAIVEVGETLVLGCEPESLLCAPPPGTPLGKILEHVRG